MTRGIALALALLLSSSGISGARLLRLGGGGGGGGSPITISAISPSSLSFTTPVSGGAATGITLGLTMTSGSGNGATFALATHSGCPSTDNASFAVPGTALPASVPINAGGSTVNANSYVICLEGTLSGATNSPFFQSFTLTGSGQTIASIAPASYNYTTGASSGTVVGPFSVTMSPPSPAFSGTLSLSTTAGGCNSTTGANNGSFAFSGINLQLATTGPSGAQAVCALASQGGLASLGQAVTVTGTSGGVAVGTRTMMNFAASTTPSGSTQTCLSAGATCFPAELYKAFAEGQVPSGQIAVPAIGATAIRYQAEACSVAWPDGSMRGCRFIMFLPQLAASATELITWTTQTGSYDHTSSGTIADITGSTDYKVEITNESQVVYATYPNPMPSYTNLILTVSGGAVTAGAVKSTSPWNGCNTIGSGSCAPFDLTMTGCATEPTVQVSFDSTSHQVNAVNIISGGSGCVVDGSGSYQLSFNLQSGLSTTTQYEKGQLVDAWETYGPLTDVSGGAAHPWLYGRVMVEHFKNADGSTYGYRAVAMIFNGLYVKGGAGMPSFQYDYCWQNGSTALHGYGGVCGTSNTVFQALHMPLQSGIVSVIPDNSYGGPAGRPDWSVNSAALNSVQLAPTLTDENDMHASGMIPPWDNSTAARATISTTPLTVTGSQNQCTDEGNYIPFSLNMTDCNAGWGAGGGHAFIGPLPTNAAIYYLGAPAMTDHGESYLQQLRLAAAGQFGGDGSGTIEPATGNAINIISTTTFPTLTPLRTDGSSRMGIDIPCSGVGSQMSSFNGGAVCDFADYGHWPSYYTLPYFLEGEEWMLRALDQQASSAFTAGCCGQQDVALGSAAYTGLLANTTNDGLRDFYWAEVQLENAAVFLPASAPDQPYYEWLMNNNWNYVDQFMNFTGTGCWTGGIPCTGYPFTKSYAEASIGYYLDERSRQTGTDYSDPLWMQQYGMWDLLRLAKQWAHKYSAIDDDVQYFVKNMGTKIPTQCPYNAISAYVYTWFSHAATLQPLTGWNSSTPGLNQAYNQDTRNTVNINTTSGSPVLTQAAGSIDFPLGSSTPLPAGSQITPINWWQAGAQTPNPDNVGTWPPPGWTEATYYYYYPLDLNDGVSSTDNAGVTFTGSMTGTALTSTTVITTTSGEPVSGVGVAGGTTIVSGGTGTTFIISVSQTVSSETMVADAGMVTASGTTTSMWGLVPNAPCPSGAGFAGSISGTTLTIPAGAALTAGWPLNGAHNDIAAGTTIVSGSGTSYQVSISQTVASEAMFAFSGNNAQWNDPGGDTAPDGRLNETLSVAEWAEAVLGPYSDADTAIANMRGVTSYPSNITPPWMLQSTY